MKIKSVIISALAVSTLLLGGCGEKLSRDEAEMERYVRGSGDATLEGWVPVGETMKVEKVAMADSYRIMVEDSERGLLWYSLEGTDVRVERTDKDYQYIERIENEVYKPKFTGWEASHSRFILYIDLDANLEDGAYPVDCGKNCTETIHVNVLN